MPSLDTLTPVATPVLPVLRLLPVPVFEPPFDDELDTPPAPLAPIGPLRALLRLVPVEQPDADNAAVAAAVAEVCLPRTQTSALPAPRPVAHGFVQTLVEVLAGHRPLRQLARVTSQEIYDELERLLAAQPRTAGSRPAVATVRSVHVQTRDDGVAEVCASVRRGDRVTAYALRMEGYAGRWRCTELVGV